MGISKSNIRPMPVRRGPGRLPVGGPILTPKAAAACLGSAQACYAKK
ncbi:hypothetical protein DUNSADRAFT_3939 [Dunaliella salina]|uniref:Encoded protein n=1 Tax=Dunaliella salina TaxID=3046 RepID=A0ABQ7H7T2_DUNSA|nr:hypothetical protein DUNSADRAFT_3939 [Dunaliella salina]|eukprot:KAF5842912.1 hypothetical protein DUNSADRAFT_3939 [Dunaliella salina]